MISNEQEFYELIHFCIESNGYTLVKSEITPGFSRIKIPPTDESRKRVLEEIVTILTSPSVKTNDERIALIRKVLYENQNKRF